MTQIRALTLLVLTGGFGIGCNAPAQDEEVARNGAIVPDINEVLRAHDDELMAIAGVTGVYVGLMDDGETPCITIMVVEKTPQLEDALPESLDGHPVVIEETGIIRPLG